MRQRSVWSGWCLVLAILATALMGADGCLGDTTREETLVSADNNKSSNNTTAGQVRLGTGEVLFPQYPSFDALREAHAKEATTPEAGLRFWYIALFQYMSADEAERTRGKAGLDHLTLPFKGNPDWEGQSSYHYFVDRMETKPYIFTSYAKGATPQNSYAIDYGRFELNIAGSSEDTSGRGWRLTVQSGGADSARPTYMKRSDQTGLWYMSEFNNLYVDIRKPVDPNAETFK